MSTIIVDIDGGENTGWKPLIAGPAVKVNLTKVGLSVKKDNEVTDNLEFSFKGSDVENSGEFSFIVWNNKFDSTDDRWTEVSQTREINRILHILKAYLPIEKVAEIMKGSWEEMKTNIITAFNAEGVKEKISTVVAELKVTLNSANKNQLPLFPDFIKTSITPGRILSPNYKKEKYKPTSNSEEGLTGGVDELSDLGAAPGADMVFDEDLSGDDPVDFT